MSNYRPIIGLIIVTISEFHSAPRKSKAVSTKYRPISYVFVCAINEFRAVPFIIECYILTAT